MRRSSALAVAVALVVAACAPSGASPPSPIASAAPSAPPPPPASAVPTAVPGNVAWAWQAPYGPPIALGGDTVYATGPAPSCDIAVHALAGDGSELAEGWPRCVDGARYLSFLATDREGSVYAGAPDRLLGLAADRTTDTWWTAPFGWLVGTMSSGIVILAPSPDGPRELRAYGPDGRVLPGWPVAVPGTVVEPAVIGPADAVAVLYRDMATGHRWVTMVEPNGSTRAGWPVAVPGDMDGASVVIDLVTTDGRVVLRAHEPWPVTDRVEAMVGLVAQVATILPDGTIPAGWPVRLAQPLSPLVEAAAGRLVAVVGDVQYGPGPDVREPTGPYGVVSIEPDGSPSPGWPAALPDGVIPLPADVAPGPGVPWALPPVVGGDGSAIVLVRGSAGEGIAWFEPDGGVASILELPTTMALSHGMPAAPGGPAKLPLMEGERAFVFVGLRRPAAQVGDGSPPVDAPAFVPALRALVAGTSGGAQDAVLAVERSGPVAGWPVVLPAHTYAGEALVTPGGMLLVAGTTEGEGDALPGVVGAVDPAAPRTTP